MFKPKITEQELLKFTPAWSTFKGSPHEFRLEICKAVLKHYKVEELLEMLAAVRKDDRYTLSCVIREIDEVHGEPND